MHQLYLGGPWGSNPAWRWLVNLYCFASWEGSGWGLLWGLCLNYHTKYHYSFSCRNQKRDKTHPPKNVFSSSPYFLLHCPQDAVRCAGSCQSTTAYLSKKNTLVWLDSIWGWETGPTWLSGFSERRDQLASQPLWPHAEVYMEPDRPAIVTSPC